MKRKAEYDQTILPTSLQWINLLRVVSRRRHGREPSPLYRVGGEPAIGVPFGDPNRGTAVFFQAGGALALGSARPVFRRAEPVRFRAVPLSVSRRPFRTCRRAVSAPRDRCLPREPVRCARPGVHLFAAVARPHPELSRHQFDRRGRRRPRPDVCFVAGRRPAPGDARRNADPGAHGIVADEHLRARTRQLRPGHFPARGRRLRARSGKAAVAVRRLCALSIRRPAQILPAGAVAAAPARAATRRVDRGGSRRLDRARARRLRPCGIGKSAGEHSGALVFRRIRSRRATCRSALPRRSPTPACAARLHCCC